MVQDDVIGGEEAKSAHDAEVVFELEDSPAAVVVEPHEVDVPVGIRVDSPNVVTTKVTPVSLDHATDRGAVGWKLTVKSDEDHKEAR